MFNKKIAVLSFVILGTSVAAQSFNPEFNIQVKSPDFKLIEKTSAQNLPSDIPKVESNVKETIDEKEVIVEESTDKVAEDKYVNESSKAFFMRFSALLKEKKVDELLRDINDDFIFIESNQNLHINKSSLEKTLSVNNDKKIKVSSINLSEIISAKSITEDNNKVLLLGNGSETYKLGLKELEVPIRWSSIVEKVDGSWKINSLHLGANHIDNDILKSHEEFGMKALMIGGFAGLVLGFLLSVLMRRKTK